MNIIPVKEEHISKIVELEKLCFAHPISESNLRKLLTGEIGAGFIILDNENNTAAAYGGIMTVADEGQILNVATHPDYRRRGFAAGIMRSLREYAEAKNISFITLEVRESNHHAIKLYKKHGFYEAGRIKGYYNTPKEDGLILRLDLV